MHETRSTCPYCGVGCGVVVQAQGGRIVGVRGDADHPANFGRLCSKGSTLHLTASERVRRDERLLQPLWRDAKDAPHRPLGWPQATQRLAERLAAVVREHGPDAVAFYISGQLLTEDYYVFNKLAKGLVGTNNIDSNSRLCMSSAVVGYRQTLGADAPPACYDDVDHADCLFITGSNAAWAHPVLFRRIEDARRARPQMKVIVVDPRRTETADFADLHLQIQPGTDVALCHGMLHAMIWEEWLDRRFIAGHTRGFDALKALVRDMTPARAAQLCGIGVDELLQAARWFATSPATLSLYCQGLNQSSSGAAKNTALIDLHLATGQIGRPGAGPFSLTGQPNAMGGREVGGMATLMSGHRDLADAAQRAEVAALWGVPEVPARPGLTAVELFQATARGEIKLLWIVCTNPAQSLPDQALVRRALQRCETVVLQEAFAGTATAPFADLLLPASTWGEKDGTVTNSERRISRVRAAVPPPGEARDDWRIAADVARALQPLLKPELPDLFPYASAEAVWNEHRETTRGRDLDITGLSWPLLDERGPQQWPFPAGAEGGRARLYEDGRFATADGRAAFVAAPYRPPAEARDARHPFMLNTGRLRDQWHGMSRSGSVPRLFGHEARPLVRLNPRDLPRRQLVDGGFVELRSRRGRIVLPLQADERVAPTQAYVAMHWGSEFVSGRGADGQALAGINALTQPAFCADAKQPELKQAAVAIAPLALGWRLTAAAWLDEAELGAARAALRARMADFDYAECVPLAGTDGRAGLRFIAASAQPIDGALVDELARRLGLQGASLLRYADPGRGRRRLLQIEGEGAEVRLKGLLLAGEAPLADWLLELWRDQAPVAEHRRALLAPEPVAPQGLATRGRQVCNCFDVAEPRIRERLAQLAGDGVQRLAALQRELHCGTQCGSCLPELRRLVQQVPAAMETSST